MPVKFIKVYLMLDPLAVPRPLQYFNFSLQPDLCQYEFVQTKVVPPVASPPNGPGGAVVKIKGPNQPILPSALITGIKFRTVEELTRVMVEVGCALPTQGTGKRGGVVKADLAKALVEHQCPDQTQDKKAWMVDKMVGRKNKQRLDDMPADIEHESEFLQLLAGLDMEDCFDKFKQFAMEKHKEVVKLKRQLSETVESQNRAAESEPTLPTIVPHEGTDKDKWQTITPRELYQLLPGKHTLPYVYLKRLPDIGKGGRYQGVYQ